MKMIMQVILQIKCYREVILDILVIINLDNQILYMEVITMKLLFLNNIISSIQTYISVKLNQPTKASRSMISSSTSVCVSVVLTEIGQSLSYHLTASSMS